MRGTRDGDEWNVRQWLFMFQKGKELTDSSEKCHKVAGRKMLILSLYAVLCCILFCGCNISTRNKTKIFAFDCSFYAG